MVLTMSHNRHHSTYGAHALLIEFVVAMSFL